MTQQANVRIDIASEFDKRGFAAAEKATLSLQQSIHKLTKGVAGLWSVQKVLAYSKASMKAYAEDQKGAALLANQLKNLGLGVATSNTNTFIAAMEKQTGILDDELRPAFAQLARVTGSVTKSQQLLNLAFNVSKGAGVDFATTVDALSQAYVGNTKGLKQLNLGLTAAELKAADFNTIQQKLNDQFGGAGQAYLSTYAGQLDALNVASANAAETIGKNLFDALGRVSGSDGFGSFIDGISKAANLIGDLLTGVSRLAEMIHAIASPSKGIGDITNRLSALRARYKQEDLQVMRERSGIADNFSSRFGYAANQAKMDAATKKAELEAQKRAKALADAIKKQNAAQADLLKKKKEAAALDALSLKYKQQEAIFDMEKIQLAAASLNKQTDEDYARIKLKQDLITLQEAIQANDLAAAQAAAKVVEEDYKRVWAYQAINIAAGIQAGTIANIKAAADLIPKNLDIINIENLKTALDYINEMLKKLASLPTGTTKTTPSGGDGSKKTVIGSTGGVEVTTVYGQGNPNLYQGSGVFDYKSPYSYGMGNPNLFANSGVFSGMQNYSFGYGNPNLLASSGAYGQQVTVTINDNTSDSFDVVTNATQQASANGVNVRLVRNTSGLNW